MLLISLFARGIFKAESIDLTSRSHQNLERKKRGLGSHLRLLQSDRFNFLFSVFQERIDFLMKEEHYCSHTFLFFVKNGNEK